MSEIRLYARFEKVDAAERMVYGYASTEALDSQGEIVKRDAVAAALPDFMRFGNIREMHQPSAVGKAKEATVDGKGLWLGAKIVDDDAWAKVKEGVYSGFSIAGQVTGRDPINSKVITGCTLSEISLVDRPANPEAVFTMYKAALAKEGRRNSRADLERIQEIHDRAAELGARCAGRGDDMEDDDDNDPDEVAKCGGGSARVAKAEATVRALEAECRRLAARLAELERSPSAPKGSLRAVAKAEDLGRADAGGERTVHDMIKAALRRPGVL